MTSNSNTQKTKDMLQILEDKHVLRTLWIKNTFITKTSSDIDFNASIKKLLLLTNFYCNYYYWLGYLYPAYLIFKVLPGITLNL